MNAHFLKHAIALAVILFFAGCAANRPLTSPFRKKPSAAFKSDDRYYYFTLSQLNKKKGNLPEAIEYLNRAISIDPQSSFLQMELAALYLQEKDREKALKAVEAVIDKDPGNIEALVIYGKIQQSLSHFEDAKGAYEKIVAADPGQRDIYFLLGDLYMDGGDLDGAFRVYQQLIENFPDSYAGYFYLGKIEAARGKLHEAETQFRKALEIEPRLEEAYFELISLYRALGQEDKVVQTFLGILKMNPGNIQAAMELGYYYHQKGNIKGAENLLKPLGERSKTEEDVIRNVLQLYLDPKNYDGAIVVLDGMLKGAPDSSDIHYVQGLAYDGKKDSEKAMAHLKKVGTDSRFYQNAAVHISFLYQEQGKISEAIEYLQGVIRAAPDNPELYLYLGSFYEEEDKFDKAEEALKQGLKIDPNNARLYFRLGVVYDKWGKKGDSIDAMKTVIRLDPKNANALNYLGYTYADLGQNLDEAERLIQEALKYKPDDGYITDSLGWVYFKKGQFKKALAILEKAVNLVPDDPVILEHLGDAYLENNDKQNALKYYKRSLLNKKTDTTEVERKIRELGGQIP